MAARYQERLSMSHVFQGSNNERCETNNSDVAIKPPAETETNDAADITPRTKHPSIQQMTTGQTEDEQSQATVSDIYAGDDSEPVSPMHASDRRYTCRQMMSHSPVMKELIEKFEMRKAESQNSAMADSRPGGDAVYLMARDAWGPSQATARLDIDPCAVTSSSFSDLSNSRNNSPRRHFTRSSSGNLTLNAMGVHFMGTGESGAKKQYNAANNNMRGSDSLSGDPPQLFPKQSQSELSVMGGTDNQTNNKDFDFVKEATTTDNAPSSTNELPVFGTTSQFVAETRSQDQSTDKGATDNTMSESVYTTQEIGGQRDQGNAVSDSPQRVSLRGLVRKQVATAAASGKSGRTSSLDHKDPKSGQIPPHSGKFKQTKSTPPPMPPGISRVPSNMTKASTSRGPSPANLPRNAQQKFNSVSPTIPHTSLTQGLSRRNSTASSRISRSRSKPSLNEEISKTTLAMSSPKNKRFDQIKMTSGGDLSRTRKLTSTDRYLNFLKRTTPSPGLDPSSDSLGLPTTHGQTQPQNIFNNPLTHKPPKRENSMNRQGSNLTGISRESGNREKTDREKQEQFKVKVHRRPSSRTLLQADTHPRRPTSLASCRKRPQSEPNKGSSNTSLAISSSGSQNSEYTDTTCRWSSKKSTITSSMLPKFHHLSSKDKRRFGSADLMGSTNSLGQFSKAADNGRMSSIERAAKLTLSKSAGTFGFSRADSVTSSSSPNREMLERMGSDSHSIHGDNPKGNDDATTRDGNNAVEGVGGAGGGGDKRCKTPGLSNMESPLNLLTDVEMADTDLIPRHLRERGSHHQGHAPLPPPRDDCVLFLTSSDDESSYLSIEDQLKKIKAKRLLQMLQGSTLMDPVSSYQPLQIGSSQQAAGRLSAKSRYDSNAYTKHDNGEYTGTASYTGSHLLPDLKAYADKAAFQRSLPDTVFTHMKGGSPTHDALMGNKKFSPEPLQFTSSPFDLVNAQELEARTGGVISRPSPLRNLKNASHLLPEVHPKSESRSGGKISSSLWMTEDYGVGNQVKGGVKGHEQPPCHFGCVGAENPAHSQSPDKATSEIGDMTSQTAVGLGSPDKSDRAKKRKMDVGKTGKKKRRRRSGELYHAKDELDVAVVQSKGNNHKSPHSKKKRTSVRPSRSGQKDEMDLSPPKPSQTPPRVIVAQQKDHTRTPSKERVSHRTPSPALCLQQKVRDSCTTIGDMTDYQSVKSKTETTGRCKPVRRLTCDPTERWPVRSRIPLITEVVSLCKDPRPSVVMWTKYRRFKEDFDDPDHRCRIPLSQSFRYNLKVAPYQEWKLHRWKLYPYEETTFNVSSYGVSDCQASPALPSLASKVRHWKRGQVRMAHLLYVLVGLLSMCLAYVIMWMVTCGGNNIDMFCQEDDVNCLVRHVG